MTETRIVTNVNNRRGFTLVEVLLVMVMLGLLSAIAVPRLRVAHQRASAAHVIADFVTIRSAAVQYYTAEGEFPPTASQGTPPAELAEYLPSGFQFNYEGIVQYRWRQWPSSVPGNSDPIAGVEFESTDETLVRLIKELYGGQMAFGTNTRVVLVI